MVAAATSVVRTGKVLRPPPRSQREPYAEHRGKRSAGGRDPAGEPRADARRLGAGHSRPLPGRYEGEDGADDDHCQRTETHHGPVDGDAGVDLGDAHRADRPEGEAATVTATASNAPTVIATSAFAIETVIRSRRVLPIAASVALCAASTCMRRESACATTTSPNSAANAANASSARTSGSVAFLTSAMTADRALEGDGLVRYQGLDSGGERVHVDTGLQLDHGAPIGPHQVGMRSPERRREQEGRGHVARVDHDAVLRDADAIDTRAVPCCDAGVARSVASAAFGRRRLELLQQPGRHDHVVERLTDAEMHAPGKALLDEHAVGIVRRRLTAAGDERSPDAVRRAVADDQDRRQVEGIRDRAHDRRVEDHPVDPRRSERRRARGAARPSSSALSPPLFGFTITSHALVALRIRAKAVEVRRAAARLARHTPPASATSIEITRSERQPWRNSARQTEADRAHGTPP